MIVRVRIYKPSAENFKIIWNIIVPILEGANLRNPYQTSNKVTVHRDVLNFYEVNSQQKNLFW